MFEFLDCHGHNVSLVFSRAAFDIPPRHVLVLCRFGNRWLLTRHPLRGLEFPGGKIEVGESVEEAAIREVFEETGAKIAVKAYIGEYRVSDPFRGPFVKAIVLAEVLEVEEKSHYHETSGPECMDTGMERELQHPKYSFIMQDLVVPKAIEFCRSSGWIS